MAKKTKFPPTLFVKIENRDSDDPYFGAHENQYGLAEQGETVKIATYTLVRIDEVELVLDVKPSE